MRHFALCYDAMRSDTMIINSIVLIVEHFLTVKHLYNQQNYHDKTQDLVRIDTILR